MGEGPVLFSGPMVRALLDGRKTQTRRVLKLPTKGQYVNPQMGGWEASTVGGGASFTIAKDGTRVAAPEQVCIWHRTTGTTITTRWQKDDRLYVREAWRCNGWASDVATIMYRASEGGGYNAMTEQYPVVGKSPQRITTGWRPGIHMPRWASRLTLVVTEVRVQRLQEIDRADALAEGVEMESADPPFYYVPGIHPHAHTAIGVEEPGGRHAERAYAKLWNNINGAGSWEANPWIAALTFAVRKRNIDA